MASEVRLGDLRRGLEQHGWSLDRIKGSHHVFVKEGEGHLSVPVHKGKVKPVYVGRLERQLGIKIR